MPVTIRANRDTWLKKAPVPAISLPANQKVQIDQGRLFHVVAHDAPLIQHVRVTLSDNAGTWYLFLPHWTFPGVSGTVKGNRPADGLGAEGTGLSGRCLSLVKEFEGCEKAIPGRPGYFEAYLDAVKIPTIGWGTTIYPSGKMVLIGDVRHELECYDYLLWTLEDLARTIKPLIKVPVTPAMLDALASFAYNVGWSALSQSTLLKLLNAGQYAKAADEFERWVYGNPKEPPLPGLIHRRGREKELFLADGIPDGLGGPFVRENPAELHHNFDAKVSEYFTWGEVWRYEKGRITDDPQILNRIVMLAEKLDAVREQFGPIGVTSWYRPSHINAAVGGASNSYHLTGGAVDVYLISGSTIQLEEWAVKHWKGGIGRGIRSGRGFVHLDDGPYGVWTYG